MTQPATASHSIFLRKTFWQKVGFYLWEDIIIFSKALGLLCAIIFGFLYFLFGFDFFKKDLLTWVIMPVILFFLVKYLTILPIFLFPLFLFVKRSWLFTVFFLLGVISFMVATFI